MPQTTAKGLKFIAQTETTINHLERNQDDPFEEAFGDALDDALEIGGLISLPGHLVDWFVALAGVYAPDPRQTQSTHPFIHPSSGSSHSSVVTFEPA